jgi:hypothetical protein
MTDEMAIHLGSLIRDLGSVGLLESRQSTAVCLIHGSSCERGFVCRSFGFPSMRRLYYVSAEHATEALLPQL